MHSQILSDSRSHSNYLKRNSPIALFYYDQIRTFQYRIPLVNFDCTYFSVFIRMDVVFHLHCFQNKNCLATFDYITYLYFDIQNYSW